MLGDKELTWRKLEIKAYQLKSHCNLFSPPQCQVSFAAKQTSKVLRPDLRFQVSARDYAPISALTELSYKLQQFLCLPPSVLFIYRGGALHADIYDQESRVK